MERDYYAVGKQLNTLNLEHTGIEIDKIIRQRKQLDPEESGILESGDLILLTGPEKAITQAEDILSKGRT